MGYNATPVYGLRTPERSNKPLVSGDMKQLAEDVDKALGAVNTVGSSAMQSYSEISSKVAELKEKVDASQKHYVVTNGAGDWSIKNGLGETVPVSSDGAGDWSIIT